MDKRNEEQLHEFLHELTKLIHEVRAFLHRKFQLSNDKLKLYIPNQKGVLKMGNPANLVVGAGSVFAIVTESLKGVQQGSFQNGVTTGVLNGPPAFASDNPAIATVDPASGEIVPVAPGVANISATDAVGNLTDSVAVTVTPGVPPPPTPNDALQLSVPAQAPATASAVKKLG